MAKHEDIPAFGNLAGVRVVISGVSTAAPFAGEMFADNGADVIWLEPPKGIDPYRWTQDGWGAQNEHRNMRNLMLDVVSEEGHEIFLKVIETADIFIEASRGGQWAKWGYTDELLWEHNPKLVIGHMSGYGQTGDPDYVKLPGYDFTVCAFSGLMYLNGYKDGPPYMIQKFVTDYYAGLFAYGSALAAYVNALKTGKGESFDLAQYEAAVRCQAGLFGKWFEKRIQEERGAGAPRDNISAGSGYYECMDGEGVYLVPLNFGFTNVQGRRTFYFHSAPEGHKIDLLRQAKTVAFELDCGCAVTPGTTACSHSANYRSVMGQGSVRFLETRMDKRAALTEIMRQNTGKDDWTFPDEAVDRVAVFALEVQTITAKQRG